MNWSRAITTMAAVVAMLGLSGRAALADSRMDKLKQSGTLRVGLFLPQYAKDSVSGELRGVGAHVVSLDVTRTLASRLGITVQFIEYRTPTEVVDCLKAGQCDLGIMGVDPTRAKEVGLSPPFMQFDFTHLVPAGSPVRKVSDADRPGMRIAAIRNHASTLVLTRMSKHATFVEEATPDGAFDLLRTGRADLFASARPTLLDYVPQLAGSRVLDDGYGVNAVALAVPKGQDSHAAFISEFLSDLKKSGWLKQRMEKAGLRGFDVSP